MPEKTQSAGTIPLRERRTLADEWKEFARQIVPKGAPPMQVREMRRAWYAGAATLFSVVAGGLDPESEPTDLDVAYLESINQELVVFSNRLGMGLE